MKSKKSESAFYSFMVSYGLAILCAVIIIFVLWLMGFFSPKTYPIPDYHSDSEHFCNHYNMTVFVQQTGFLKGQYFCMNVSGDKVQGMVEIIKSENGSWYLK